jgi:hypothetical protein
VVAYDRAHYHLGSIHGGRFSDAPKKVLKAVFNQRANLLP